MASATPRRRIRPSDAAARAARHAQLIAYTLGIELRKARDRRRLTQEQLAYRARLSQPRLGELERGEGASAPLDTWLAVADALGRRLIVEWSRDPEEEPIDGGHLKVQELVLRLARNAGYDRTFELPTRQTPNARSIDVCLRDPRRHQLIVVEVWNRLDDIGAAVRATNRKLAEVREVAAGLGDPNERFRTGACWILRDTPRNRALVTRYPEAFASQFPGSSRGWLRALREGAQVPAQPGLVWADAGGTRLFDWRRTS